MQFISYRELCDNAPSILRKKLSSESVLVITTGNKPIAAMISLDSGEVQDTLLMISRMRTQLATRSIRSQAHRDGLNGMTLKDVNTLIKKTRGTRTRLAAVQGRSGHLS